MINGNCGCNSGSPHRHDADEEIQRLKLQVDDLKAALALLKSELKERGERIDSANRLIEVLRNALVKIEAHAPKSYEPNQEHWEWGNFDDSYGYGLSTGYHRMGEIASAALKETNQEKRSDPVQNGCEHDWYQRAPGPVWWCRSCGKMRE